LIRGMERDGQLQSLLHFSRRKFCDMACMAQGFKGRFKITVTSPTEGRYRARTIKRAVRCEACGTTRKRLDVHHLDENSLNNDPANLIALCRSCHLRQHRKMVPCSICGNPQKGLGYCDKHYQRFKKWGDPLAFKRNQHSPLSQSAD